MRAERESERERQREREREQQEQSVTGVLAEQQLELADRLCQDDLERAAPGILGERPHRDRGDEEQEHPRQEIEHRAERRDAVHVYLAEEEEAVHGGEYQPQDGARRVVEHRPELPAGGPGAPALTA